MNYPKVLSLEYKCRNIIGAVLATSQESLELHYKLLLPKASSQVLEIAASAKARKCLFCNQGYVHLEHLGKITSLINSLWREKKKKSSVRVLSLQGPQKNKVE